VNRHRCETNLDDLCRRLDDYSRANLLAVPAQLSKMAKRLSDSLYLAHSTADAKFADICGSGYLTSLTKPLSPARTEVVMGTVDSVFFYVAPFRYPNTGCGLLFAPTLESACRDEGVATPFDSGGLVNRLTRPDPTEPVRQFLARHELPAPEHRRYLGLSMDILFEKPEDYVEGAAPRLPGPIGLTGGDQRRWTHEVRISDRVFVRGSHLQAVFAPRARVAADSRIEALFRWCAGEDVDRIVFGAPRGNDFEALRRECLAYIRRTLY
jgi:hypothetical protein